LTEIDAALAALGGDHRSRAREVDLLRFQVGELAAAGITHPDEDGS
jgi:DNA repair protein RecN (Recombination protein N)